MYGGRDKSTGKRASQLGAAKVFRALAADGGFGGAEEVLSLACLLPDLRSAFWTHARDVAGEVVAAFLATTRSSFPCA